VKLRSANPRDTPLINFHYFEEGNDGGGEDLQAVMKGLKMLRGLAAQPEAAPHLGPEALPGPGVQTDQQLRQFARDQAWGHHASCTARIGARDDQMAVLDSRFRVRGVKGLRVVDASSFPRTPGFYPLAAILMISEKAADAVLEECL
jgi:choline dehydrogenase